MYLVLMQPVTPQVRNLQVLLLPYTASLQHTNATWCHKYEQSENRCSFLQHVTSVEYHCKLRTKYILTFFLYAACADKNIVTVDGHQYHHHTMHQKGQIRLTIKFGPTYTGGYLEYLLMKPPAPFLQNKYLIFAYQIQRTRTWLSN